MALLHVECATPGGATRQARAARATSPAPRRPSCWCPCGCPWRGRTRGLCSTCYFAWQGQGLRLFNHLARVIVTLRDGRLRVERHRRRPSQEGRVERFH